MVMCRFMHHSIAGGEDAEVGEFPYLGMIAEEGLGICAGSVLTENLILTAGHCFERSEFNMAQPSNLSFYLGDVSRNPRTGGVHASLLLQVKEIFWHELYTSNEPGKQWYDIGLLLLDESIDFSTSLHVNQTKLYRENKHFKTVDCVIAGWGYNATYHFTRKLQKAKVPIRKSKTCRKDWKPFNETLQICAKDYYCHPGHCPDICSGDSGGPLLCPLDTVDSKSSNQTILGQIGIISGGYPPCADSTSSYFLRIPPFIEWITKHAEKYSERKLLFVN